MLQEINKNDIFLKGTHVILKVLTEDDVHNSNWYGWFNDEETTRFMQKHYYPNTEELELEFLKESISTSKTKLQLGICDVKGGPIVGVVGLNDIDYMNQKAEVSMIIGEARYQKVKYMVEAFRLIMNHAFNNLNLHRIYGGSIVNEWAELLCRTLGFKREGVLRQDVFKNGKYNDVYLIGVLKEEFEQAQKEKETLQQHESILQ